MTNEEIIRNATESFVQDYLSKQPLPEAVGELIFKVIALTTLQFKEYLENLKNAYIKDSDNLFNRGLTMSSERYNSQIECINRIINEFFKEN